MGQTFTIYVDVEDAKTVRAELNRICGEEGFGMRYSAANENRGALPEALRALVLGDAALVALPRQDMDEAIEGLRAIPTPWARDLGRSLERAKARREKEEA
jgi:hypothetical protein